MKKKPDLRLNIKPEFPYLHLRIARERLFNKDAKIPESPIEIIDMLETLACELSPENLTADGELSKVEVDKKLININGAWRELEQKLGRKISLEEVEEELWNKSSAKLVNRK